MTTEKKFELYNQAKESYYNGNPIMGDVEFDELEKSLGLENSGNIGTIRNPKYTVKHPFIMGSLSKVQIHENKKDRKIDWKKYYSDAYNYFNCNDVIVSPKYDGCSFEIVFIKNEDHYELLSCSGRGDGHYGKDLTPFLQKHISKLNECLNESNKKNQLVVLRGEILIDKNVFEKKYWSGRIKENDTENINEFVNPRSFVAGVIGNDYDDDNKDLKSRIDDLSLIIYFIAYPQENIEDDFINSFIAKEYLPEFYYTGNIENSSKFEEIYNKFDEVRKNSKFNLDGFVIKPTKEYRDNICSDPRPKDCVAIKFLPMIAKTKVTNIEWNLGKSGEYIPNVRFEPVIMDGKQVSKANGFNYGYIVENKICIGTELTISLAGDIIPYIYEIGNPGNDIDNICFDKNLPHEIIDNLHLIAIKSKEEIENDKLYFSILSLNIPGMGPELAKKVVSAERNKLKNDDIIEDFFGISETNVLTFPTNILMISPEDLKNDIEGKNGQKIAKAFEKICKQISLQEIIITCNFKLCGYKVSEQCAKYLLNEKYDFSSMASIGYNWVLDENSENYQTIMSILSHLNRPLSYFKTEDDEKEMNKIPIIMTGEPNNYSTKREFIKAHPEYRETTSWKEVKIVFTNDLNSNTGKMKKAREKNIEIRIY